ncbi:MAG: hypothetical protein KY394_03220 [Actinobacteria bacterium]|nr:hypothetical protein [Actinomycetota bacterium]
MLKRFSDQDVELLLSGRMPESEDLARLAPILEALHARRSSLSEERVSRFAAKAAEIAISTRQDRAHPAAPERAATRPRRFVLALRQKMATGLAAVLLLSGMTGVAVASDHSAPGDALYGLDRALEAVGVGDGGAVERIAEAQALFQSGRIAEAIAHAAEAVPAVEDDGLVEVVIDDQVEVEGELETSQIGSSNAADALFAAAAQVQNGDGDDESELVRQQVASMLAAMALMMQDTEFDGEAFGQQVAEMARGIGGDNEGEPENEAQGSADDGLDTADEATDNAGDGLDTARDADDEAEEADDAADNGDTAEGSADEGLDTAGDNTEEAPSGRP